MIGWILAEKQMLIEIYSLSSRYPGSTKIRQSKYPYNVALLNQVILKIINRISIYNLSSLSLKRQVRTNLTYILTSIYTVAFQVNKLYIHHKRAPNYWSIFSFGSNDAIILNFSKQNLPDYRSWCLPPIWRWLEYDNF